MAQHRKTAELIGAAREALAGQHPMTVRQVFYQLVSRQAIENTPSRYNALCTALVAARQEGVIRWDWIEDRLRRPRTVSMWDGLGDFAETVRQSYRRNVWASQPTYLEAWVEKDALSGIFEDVLRPYGVTLNVGRGYDGWDSIRNATERFKDWGGEDWDGGAILYFGDLDPSGDDMVRSLRERLGFFGCEPEIVKCALTRADVKRYSLPPGVTKKTDTRRAAYVEAQGEDIAVELDALPVGVLRERIRAEVEARMDLDALAQTRRVEATEVERLTTVMAEIDAGNEGGGHEELATE